MEILRDPAVVIVSALLAAILGGMAAAAIRVPRVVGYLVAGLALRQVFGLLGADLGGHGPVVESAGVIADIKSLALGLILFTLGAVFEADHLRTVGARILRISAVELLCTFLLVAIGAAVVWWFVQPGSLAVTATAAVLLGLIALATAPAATVLVLQECQAKGAMSDSLLTLTALNNAFSIVAFHVAALVLATLGLLGPAAGGVQLLLVNLLLTTVGSVGVGLLVGFVLSVLYARLGLSEFVLVFIGALLGLGVTERFIGDLLNLNFSFLLTSLAIGAAFANITLDQQPLRDLLSIVGRPLYACFFVLAGFELHLEDLGMIGVLGVAYIALRSAGKVIGGHVGARRARAPADVRGYLGLGLLCQAGVAIGLVDFLSHTWVVQTPDGLAPNPAAIKLKTVVLGSIVVFELFGPLLLRHVAVRSGEVTAIAMLRGRRSASTSSESSLRLAWDALLRIAMPRRQARAAEQSGGLTVRQIMRSNTRLLRADAKLDEVLEFVERSREHHFPVVDQDSGLVGMIHFSDLRNLLYAPEIRDLVTAHDLARQSTPLVSAEMPLDQLFDEFEKADVGSLPVVASESSRRVVGLVEQRDLLKLLHQRAGA